MKASELLAASAEPFDKACVLVRELELKVELLEAKEKRIFSECRDYIDTLRAIHAALGLSGEDIFNPFGEDSYAAKIDRLKSENAELRRADEMNKLNCEIGMATLKKLRAENAELRTANEKACALIDEQRWTQEFYLKECDDLRTENAELNADRERLCHALNRIGFFFAGTEHQRIAEAVLGVLAGKTLEAALEEYAAARKESEA